MLATDLRLDDLGGLVMQHPSSSKASARQRRVQCAEPEPEPISGSDSGSDSSSDSSISLVPVTAVIHRLLLVAVEQ